MTLLHADERERDDLGAPPGLAEPAPRRPVGERSARTMPAAELGHWVVAALLSGAGAIHLAMAPPHLGESTVHGVGFLVAGVLGIGLALWVAVRPSRTALWMAAVTSAALIGAWAVSRRVGLPYGSEPWVAEAVTVVDGIAVILEAAAVLLVASLLVRRGTVFVESTAFAVAGVFGALVLTSGALASPAAREHAVDGHGGEHAASDHATGVPVGDDRGFGDLANGQMGSHGHPGEAAAPVEESIDPAAAASLAGQLALTAPLVEAYPTLGDARAAGFVQQGPFSPGLGVHFGGPFAGGLNLDGDMDAEDIGAPTLIYDGLEEDAPLAGFMYLAFQDTEPEGFAGPLDHWHYHTATCVVLGPDGIETPFGADLSGVTDAMCEAEGGLMIDFTGYMVHVWTVPGYESDLGTFSDLNPDIACPDGTYYTIPTAEIGGADTTCRDAAT